MNARTLIALAFLWPAAALAQGFAGLGTSTEGHALPSPETRLEFPTDHGSHPDFRIEWWYVTANLQDANGTPYGIQWTLFRNALTPTGAPEDQAWMGHAALSTPEAHLFAERLARGGIGQAGVTALPFEAFIDEWRMAGDDLNEITLTAQGSTFAYDLTLASDRPFVPQGDAGFSVKSEAGQASHYYSQPFYEVTGTITVGTTTTAVTGQGWLDREWSSQPLSQTQTGWDWISLHFDTGEKLMGYRLRDETAPPYTIGTWIASDGTPAPLEDGQLTMIPAGTTLVAGRTVPTAWDITLPAKNLTIRAEALRPDSWMSTSIPYWEGPVDVTGTHPGVGYLEMSGYAAD